MAGVILETLSNKKLIAFTIFAFLCQFVCFLVGGLISPAPYNVQSLLAVKCVSSVTRSSKWYEPWGDHQCQSVNSLRDKEVYEKKINANQIVFSLRFPLRKSNVQLDMSRWHQNIIAVLQVDVNPELARPVESEAEMTLEAQIGYKNKGEPNTTDWHELVSSTEKRQLKCSLSTSDNPDEDGTSSDRAVYKCDLLPLFELGSCHHDYYLINIRLPVKEDGSLNQHLPEIEDIWVFVIHPNGGFTKVWLSLKTIMCPMSIIALCWHIYRVKQQNRPFSLLEKMLIGTGFAMSFLNLPVEWFTLWIYMPYMLLFSDIRQGIFYSVLMSFWVIFVGEHMMDQVDRKNVTDYWKHLSAVAFGCICLFVFEMCERGVQLHNPLWSIWSTPASANMALAFIVLAGAAACVYFLFLLYMVIKVLRNISAKKSSLPQMSKARRKFYMGLIYRFNFLMVMTLICAAVTIIFLILGQVVEGHWKWDESRHIEYTSGFMTGAYGMWNIYVISLLILYAPSTKHTSLDTDANEDEAVEFANIPSEASALTSLAQKEQLD